MAANIKHIEEKVVFDNAFSTGPRVVGFESHYEHSRFTRSCALFSEHSRDLTFYAADGCAKTVQIDERIEALGIYHAQYGIPLDDAHNCFFITSWKKGIYCCSLDTGKILWNYRLKHATKIFLYDEYLVCAFQEIGLRKVTYNGEEIAKYPFSTYEACFRLDDPYILCGPKRGIYMIIDTRTMDVQQRIKCSTLSPSGDASGESLVLIGAEGTCRDFVIRGFENEQRFEKHMRF